MRRLLLLAALLPAACGIVPVFEPDTARLTTAQLGSGFDPDVTAVQLAAWAFSDPGRTAGRPVEAARATASMDYIAGQLYTSPRWAHISALTKMQLLDGRQEVRQALGVAPDAPSQAVVDHLTFAGNALAAGDRVAAVSQLGGPVFLQGGEETLARLNNLPPLPKANVATQGANNQLFRNDRIINR